MKLVFHLFQHDRILDNNPVGNAQLLDFVKTLEIRVLDFALGNLSAVGIA